ncbi:MULTISPECIES: Stp1/IreP family PP2C-type Ser/Thr phosphatase [unclassified Candidatus Frackibacter]|uniref:Stp1/IreP family PP2C-type Ser/Thr phosphatase n=1 Tax=unclassified Candidatus Frackibacter TaxID=2648818 RepID=UPI000880D9A4|nr:MULTISPECIES: Stp1/IreP family PP2C-type Ser/Thr phosphatase [unclassified Candidatus Frackibacter]SDC57569.1 protein phosphatase [Candidatus Frackibacter sp. WG11]SEM71662.1 protein phosphatase [Candidatus Frackibacter sp. WG12]SFL82613.1 protein phosphatase [Candidatus Frackibacter sp. WG13]
MEYGLESSCGQVRDSNEDNYLQLIRPSFALFAVADGMGGHNAGEVASSIAVEVLREYDFELDNIVPSVYEVIESINRRILEEAKTNAEYQGMGTTLTMTILIDDKLYIGHVGDSRAYLLRDKEFKQLTEDHSLVNQLVKRGEITRQEARNHPQNNILLQALGTDTEVDIDILEIDIRENDLFLLCTDGLNCMLEDRKIKSVLLESGELEEKAEKLVQLANKYGGHDNITVVLFNS